MKRLRLATAKIQIREYCIGCHKEIFSEWDEITTEGYCLDCDTRIQLGLEIEEFNNNEDEELF
jgi:hypothetical protein